MVVRMDFRPESIRGAGRGRPGGVDVVLDVGAVHTPAPSQPTVLELRELSLRGEHGGKYRHTAAWVSVGTGHAAGWTCGELQCAWHVVADPGGVRRARVRASIYLLVPRRIRRRAALRFLAVRRRPSLGTPQSRVRCPAPAHTACPS